MRFEVKQNSFTRKSPLKVLRFKKKEEENNHNYSKLHQYILKICYLKQMERKRQQKKHQHYTGEKNEEENKL